MPQQKPGRVRAPYSKNNARHVYKKSPV